MKPQLWQFLFMILLAACGGNNEVAKSEDDNLGIKTADEKKVANLAMIEDAKKTIQDGDLVLRTGNDYSSEQVKQFSQKDKTYSHGGIAFHDSGNIYVYHVVPDYFHIKDKVRKELLDSFCNPVNNIGFGIARYKLDTTELRIFHEYLGKQYQKKIPFDVVFDLKSDDSMYCSEMIKKGLILATKDRIHIENIRFSDRSKYKVVKQYLKMQEKDFVGREFVPIDHLFTNPNCEVLKRFVFE
jgi:hypothetical protein